MHFVVKIFPSSCRIKIACLYHKTKLIIVMLRKKILECWFFVLTPCAIILKKSCQRRNGELLTGESQLENFMKNPNLFNVINERLRLWIGLTNFYVEKNYSINQIEDKRLNFWWTNNTRRTKTSHWDAGKSSMNP